LDKFGVCELIKGNLVVSRRGDVLLGSKAYYIKRPLLSIAFNNNAFIVLLLVYYRRGRRTLDRRNPYKNAISRKTKKTEWVGNKRIYKATTKETS